MTDRPKPTVSLLMIVKSEEHQLADCLRPVASLFDEIVVVDTGSRDQTKRVAAQFTPHVFDFAWCDDFSAARNESLRRSHGDWLFWLDADDRLSPGNVASLSALFARLDDRPQAYWMNTVCSSQHACEGVNLVTHTRLFRRHPALHWRGRVHEQLRPDVASLGFTPAWSDVQIDHLGYQEPLIEQRKLQRDVQLLRLDYGVDPDDASTLVHLGLTHFRLGQYDEAQQFLERLLPAASARAEHLRQVYGALATMAIREAKLQPALAILDRGLALFPDAEDLLYLRADCHYDLDRYAEAKITLCRILANRPAPQYRGGVPGDIQHKLAPCKLADVLRLERDFAGAEVLLQGVLQRFPDDSLCWHALGRVYLESGQRLKLLGVIDRLRSCPQGDVFASLLLATWHLVHQELDVAGELIEKLIAQAPQMPLPHVLWAEWLARTGASISDRAQACRDILRVQPGNIEARRVLQSLAAAIRDVPVLPGDRSPSIVPGVGALESVGTA